MATQKEIKVGSIVLSGAGPRTGIVLAFMLGRLAAHIYWFKGKYIDWYYIDCLKVLVK